MPATAKPQFRKLCSKVAASYHWSKKTYSPPERRIKAILEEHGLIEGKDFVHNKRIKYSNRISYYPDFLVFNKFIIEYSPHVWHKLYWNMEERFKLRTRRLKELGYEVFTIEREEEIERKVKQILKQLHVA